MPPVDLLLGGSLGAWMLEIAAPDDIGVIVTSDPSVAQVAGERGLPVFDDVAGEYEAQEIALSVHYPTILDDQALARYERVYNLHPGLLPWGRGMYPVFWALWERTPAGVTLHEMVREVDRGPVVAQAEVSYGEADTGGSLHRRVQQAERALMIEHWPKLVARQPPDPQPQAAGGSFHTLDEFLALQRGEAWRGLGGEELVRLVRCLTFPGHPGLIVSLGDRHHELSARALELS